MRPILPLANTGFPAVSAADHRFRQHIHHIPSINPHYWAVTLTGIADGALAHPSILTWDDLIAYPAVELTSPVICGHTSSKPEFAPLMYNAVWRGVPVSALLADLELRPHAAFANIHAADGYSTFLTLDQLREAVLVYSMNGSPIPLEHGYPTRLIVPGLAGYKLPKWVERISFSMQPDPGTWESRGWDAIGTLSGVRAALLNGVDHAFSAGAVRLHGVIASAQTEYALAIQIDGQRVANVPFTSTVEAPHMDWQTWSIDWTPPHPGDFYVQVYQLDTRAPYGRVSNLLHAMALHVR